MTKKALKENPAGLDVIVDNRASKENVTRYAKALGYNVAIEEGNGCWTLKISK